MCRMTLVALIVVIVLTPLTGVPISHVSITCQALPLWSGSNLACQCFIAGVAKTRVKGTWSRGLPRPGTPPSELPLRAYSPGRALARRAEFKNFNAFFLSNFIENHKTPWRVNSLKQSGLQSQTGSVQFILSNIHLHARVSIFAWRQGWVRPLVVALGWESSQTLVSLTASVNCAAQRASLL